MDQVEILKKVKGNSLVKLIELDQDNYYKKLAKVPQKSYDNFVKDVKFLVKNGCRFDPNAGNILYDSNNNKFNIIDHHPYSYLGDCLKPFIEGIKYTFELEKSSYK